MIEDARFTIIKIAIISTSTIKTREPIIPGLASQFSVLGLGVGCAVSGR